MTGYRRRGRPAGLMGFLFGAQADYVKGLMPLFGLCMGLFVFSMGTGFYMGDRVTMEVLEDMLGAFPDLAEIWSKKYLARDCSTASKARSGLFCSMRVYASWMYAPISLIK